MAGKLVATAVVDVDNMISDTDDSGSYIEVEVDSDGNEIISGITISNPHNNMKATVKTTSASVGGMILKNKFQFYYFSYDLNQNNKNNKRPNHSLL